MAANKEEFINKAANLLKFMVLLFKLKSMFKTNENSFNSSVSKKKKN